MNNIEKGPAPRKLLQSLVDRQSDVVLDKRRVASIQDIVSPPVPDPEVVRPLVLKAALRQEHEFQIRGHNRRPTKKSQRTSTEGESLAKAREAREGTRLQAMAEQTDLWLNGSGSFATAKDQVRIREIFDNSSEETDETTIFGNSLSHEENRGLRIATIEELQQEDLYLASESEIDEVSIQADVLNTNGDLEPIIRTPNLTLYGPSEDFRFEAVKSISTDDYSQESHS